jgi:hypoxanthine phosphoribosyltransferase
MSMTLDAASFAAECARLAALVAPWKPEVVVGIATGGEIVARKVVESLPDDPVFLPVTIQRPSTAVKGRLRVGPVLRKLPAPVKKALRELEVAARERLLATTTKPVAKLGADGTKLEALVDDEVSRILVIDDTIDSGRTMRCAVQLVRAVNPTAAIRTAVVASTWKKPPVRPDWCLHDRTLISFPWSFDAAG